MTSSWHICFYLRSYIAFLVAKRNWCMNLFVTYSIVILESYVVRTHGNQMYHSENSIVACASQKNFDKILLFSIVWYRQCDSFEYNEAFVFVFLCSHTFTAVWSNIFHSDQSWIQCGYAEYTVHVRQNPYDDAITFVCSILLCLDILWIVINIKTCSFHSRNERMLNVIVRQVVL